MEQISSWMLTGNNLAIATSGFLGVIALMYIIYNSMSYVILKERYHGIRFTTKNIAYITMFTAVSVSVTVVISLTIPITVFPPVRIAFEGVMVKITGFIFGPIVGLIVGFITEILAMIFVPSFVHPAFIIVTVAYGFVSGMGASFLRAGKGKHWFILFLINAFLIGFAALMFYLIGHYQGDIPVLGFKFKPRQFQILFLVIIGVTLAIVWCLTIVLRAKKKQKILHTFLPILLFAIANEFLVTTLISAWGDGEFLGLQTEGTYVAMFISRLVQAPIKIVFNTIILYFAYTAVAPLIKRDR